MACREFHPKTESTVILCPLNTVLVWLVAVGVPHIAGRRGLGSIHVLLATALAWKEGNDGCRGQGAVPANKPGIKNTLKESKAADALFFNIHQPPV